MCGIDVAHKNDKKMANIVGHYDKTITMAVSCVICGSKMYLLKLVEFDEVINRLQIIYPYVTVQQRERYRCHSHDVYRMKLSITITQYQICYKLYFCCSYTKPT